jgi:hypothetical protein
MSAQAWGGGVWQVQLEACQEVQAKLVVQHAWQALTGLMRDVLKDKVTEVFDVVRYQTLLSEEMAA